VQILADPGQYFLGVDIGQHRLGLKLHNRIILTAVQYILGDIHNSGAPVQLKILVMTDFTKLVVSYHIGLNLFKYVLYFLLILIAYAHCLPGPSIFMHLTELITHDILIDLLEYLSEPFYFLVLLFVDGCPIEYYDLSAGGLMLGRGVGKNYVLLATG